MYVWPGLANARKNRLPVQQYRELQHRIGVKSPGKLDEVSLVISLKSQRSAVEIPDLRRQNHKYISTGKSEKQIRNRS